VTTTNAMMMKMGTTTKMIDIKDRLARLSALAKGPELIWPHTANVADAAIARIEQLERELSISRMAQVVMDNSVEALTAERDARIDPAHVQALINAAEPVMAEALAALEADNARLQAQVRFLERKIVSNG